MTAYATPADYFGKIAPGQPITADAAELARIAGVLEDAQEQVMTRTRGARYQVDADGYPTDPTIQKALRRATVAWAEYFEEVGDTVGAPNEYDSVRYGSVSLTTAASSTGKAAAATLPAQKALTILQNAGLLSTRVSQSRW